MKSVMVRSSNLEMRKHSFIPRGKHILCGTIAEGNHLQKTRNAIYTSETSLVFKNKLDIVFKKLSHMVPQRSINDAFKIVQGIAPS